MVYISKKNNIKLREKKIRKKINLELCRCPQKKGICSLLKTVSPKKPSSARRKVALIKLVSTNEYVWSYLPGENHSLQQYGMVLIQGGRKKDIPGVRFTTVRGKFDFKGVERRVSSRSRYGTRRWKSVGKRV